jgi:putative peptidoglycan lipid II flippase
MPSASIEVRGAARTAGILIVGSAIGQIFTVLRTIFVAAKVGAGQELDAALLALVVPTMLANLIINSLPVVLVPAYIRRRDRDRVGAAQLGGWMLGTGVIVGVLGSVAVALSAGLVVAITGPGLTQEGRALVISLAPFAAPTVLFGATAALLSAVCQATGRSGTLAVSWAIGGVVAFAVVVGAWESVGVSAYVLGSAGSFLATSAVLAVVLFRDRLLTLRGVGAEAAEARAAISRALPLAGGTVFSQFNELIDRAVASLVSVGAVSTLRYAEQLATAPVRLLVPGWSAAIYPALSRQAAKSFGSTGGREASRSIAMVLAVTTPIAVGLAALGPLIVAVAYGRGNFHETAADDTARTLAAFAPLVVLAMVNAVAVSAHNAAGRTRLVGFVSLLNAAANLVLDLLLGFAFGVAGIAIATSLATLATALVLCERLAHSEPGFNWPEIRRAWLFATAAAGVPGVATGVVAWGYRLVPATSEHVLVLLALGAGFAAFYFAISRTIGFTEPFEIARSLRGGGR